MFNIWNFWADKYDKLWVQKYSLRPTRNYIISSLADIINDKKIKILDLGCGPGELISELTDNYNNIEITGIDFSEKMLEISKKRNSSANHIKMDAAELSKLNGKYDIIICTHSLPYYKEPRKVFEELYNLLNSGGRILVGFASGDSFYDKLILSMVKLTTGKANYPSDIKFRQLISPCFNVVNLKIIREKIFMPRIAVYTLKKVEL
jgi:ubiquinone/menaquinone biosynthesis C-methylase UbiE